MLSNISISIATNLAELFVDKGYLLTPKPATLLQELTSSIFNNLFSKVERKYLEQAISTASQGAMIENKGSKSYSQSTHDIIMDNYIEELTQIVSNHISFTRSVVNKEVSKLIDSVTEALNNYKYKEPEEFFNVTYFKLHDVFKSYLIDEEIASYKDSSRKYFFEPMYLEKALTEDFDLLGYILVGEEELDRLITSWFNELGRDKALYYLTQNVPEYSLSTKSLLDYSLINYLFYRNLLNKADLNIGLSSIQLKGKSSASRDYFANKLNIALELYRREIRNDYIFSTDTETSFSIFNTKSLNVVIYEENFQKLAEAGGSIEVIFGYLASKNKIDVTVGELIAEKEKYLSNWKNTRSLYLLHLNNSRLDIFKQILSQKFDESLNNLTEAEVEDGFNSPNYMETTRQLAKEYIDNLTLSDIDNLDIIAIELVARIRFRFSNAYFILKEMKEIMGMDDKIEPMEAALLATIKYVTDFLIEQLDAIRV